MNFSYSMREEVRPTLGDESHHLRLAREKREGALSEYEVMRFTNVADLALKCVEQVIEAIASRENVHFHISPRSAHAQRNRWAKEKFPSMASKLDLLWSAYGDLGYDGLDGNRARDAIDAMEKIIGDLEKQTGVGVKQAC